MVETQTFKVPPAAPVVVVVGALANVAVHQGRNTSAAELGKPINND